MEEERGRVEMTFQPPQTAQNGKKLGVLLAIGSLKAIAAAMAAIAAATARDNGRNDKK